LGVGKVRPPANNEGWTGLTMSGRREVHVGGNLALPSGGAIV